MTRRDVLLLRLHIEAVWGVQLAPIEQEEVEILPESQQPPWKLCAAEVAHERILIWRQKVSFEEQEKLRLYLDDALDFSSGSKVKIGMGREIAFSLTDFSSLDKEHARHIIRSLSMKDRTAIEAFQADSADYFMSPDKVPLIGVLDAGRLVCLAHSSRRTGEACELGIDTLPGFRRRGYALAATIAWTQAVLHEGLVPLYSALAENAASLRLAEAAGYRSFARVVTL